MKVLVASWLMYVVGSSELAFPSFSKGLMLAFSSSKKGLDFALPSYSKGFDFVKGYE